MHATLSTCHFHTATEINSHDINCNQLKTEMEIATEISQRWRERKRVEGEKLREGERERLK